MKQTQEDKEANAAKYEAKYILMVKICLVGSILTGIVLLITDNNMIWGPVSFVTQCIPFIIGLCFLAKSIPSDLYFFAKPATSELKKNKDRSYLSSAFVANHDYIGFIERHQSIRLADAEVLGSEKYLSSFNQPCILNT